MNNREKREIIFKLIVGKKDLVRMAVNESGTYEPEENMSRIEEQLTMNEYDAIKPFYEYLHKNNLKFGHANFESRVREFSNIVTLA